MEQFESQSGVDYSRPLTVSSCGEYRLKTRPMLRTVRPYGRMDYQLLYVASGKARFQFYGEEKILNAGSMVLYVPGQPQDYGYYLEDEPQIFWLHFSGSHANKILNQYLPAHPSSVIYAGINPEYKRLFRQIILELQLAKPLYMEMLANLLTQIFVLIGRQQIQREQSSPVLQKEIEEAIGFFRGHFQQKISISDYAQELHVSTAWFIRSFKLHTGITPAQYILSVRIANAQNLLEQTNYSISEIASIVGYENPLYFSRLFRKQLGLSPQQYRQKHSL